MGLSSYFKCGKEYCIYQCKCREGKDNEIVQPVSNIYLGRPISKNDWVFFNKEDSLFKFNIDNLEKVSLQSIFNDINIKNFEHANYVWNKLKDRIVKNDEQTIVKNTTECDINKLIEQTEGHKASILCEKQCFYVVRFGATFFINQLIYETEYELYVINQISLHSAIHSDIIKALIIYRLGYGETYSKIQILHKQDVASLLFPNFNFSSQKLSQYLNILGSPTLRLNFIYHHINFLRYVYRLLKLRIHLDSTHFDNKCFLYISRYYRHNNEKHNGFRLLVAVHIPTGLPLYYEIFSGNIIDKTILEPTIENISHFGCKVEHFSGDAGFANISTIERLIFLDNLESFTTRLNSNYTIFKDVIDKELDSLLTKQCESFKRNNTIIRCKKTCTELCDQNNITNKKKVFIYVYLDEDTRAKKISDLKKSKRYTSMSVEEFDNEVRTYGTFALISMRDLTHQQALEEYYDRISIEEFFNVLKNELDAEPVRLHSQETVYGHILLCFIASFFHILIKKRMKLFDTPYINIAPTYNGDNFRECDNANLQTDVLEQALSKRLLSTPISYLFTELRGQFANVYCENLIIGNEIHPITTIVPVYPNSQASSYYNSFGLASPVKIVYFQNIFNFYYGSNKTTGNTRKIAFSDHLCKEDLIKLACKGNKDNRSYSGFELDNFYKLFDARVNGRSSGRPKGSLNKATLEKKTDVNDQDFNHFDDFFALLEASLKRKPGRPKGSLNKATLERMTDGNDQAFNHRPKGSLNKATLERMTDGNDQVFNHFDDFFALLEASLKRKPGRPKGSLNKATLEKHKS